MRTFQRLIMGLLAALLGGCGQKPSLRDAPVLKVAVFADGRFTVDGVDSSLPALAEALERHRERRGVVWYYREEGPNRNDPPPIARDVFKTVVAAQLPIRLSSRPDYSDTVDAKGRSIPTP